MDRAPQRPLFDLGAFEVMTVSMAAGQNTVSFTPSFPVDHLKQMWLLQHTVTNSSVALVRVAMGGSTALRWRDAITNNLGGACLFIAAGTAGSGNSSTVNHSLPTPLLGDDRGCGSRDLNFAFSVTAPDGTAMTHSGITLWFALTMADKDERFRNSTMDSAAKIAGTRTY